MPKQDARVQKPAVDSRNDKLVLPMPKQAEKSKSPLKATAAGFGKTKKPKS